MAPKKPPDDPAQAARFVETAKALGVDESGKAFARALDAIVPPKRSQEKRTARRK